MKQFYIAWLAVSVIFISTDRLFSQDRTISTDTSWRYTYTSETDSTFRSRDLHTEIDSANIREIIRMSTEELDGDWQSGTKRRELYDSNGVLISVLDFSWDAVFGQWNENSLSEFYIDAYGSDTLIKLSTKSGDDWIVTMVFRTECTYDASGQLIQEIFINGPPGEEAAHRKQEYTLDASGNRIVTLRYNYDTDWVLFQKSETSYNEQGLILE
ncbi:MAG: hypothetical protein U9R60_10110, partial [Bacteroidota bacterium]|nr:hypothetical protein [Bacteroidota bacterium]